MKYLKTALTLMGISLCAGAINTHAATDSTNPANPSNPANSGDNMMTSNPSNTTSNTPPGNVPEGGYIYGTTFGRNGNSIMNDTTSANNQTSSARRDYNEAGVVMNKQIIKNAQQALNQQGFDVRVDGICGRSTSTAVRSFQSQKGLIQSGKLDMPTLNALGVSTRTDGMLKE